MRLRSKCLQTAAAWTLAIAVGSASACVNTVGTDHQGRAIELHDRVGKELVDSLFWRDDRFDSIDEIRRVATAARRTPDFANLTNLAVAALRAAQHDSAIRLLLSIERRYPGRYETAANLGTALELSGYDAAALRWIEIGIRRDPRSHQGSEWLHAQILRMKLALAKNPKYLETHSIAGIASEDALIPSIPTRLPSGNDGRRWI